MKCKTCKREMVIDNGDNPPIYECVNLDCPEMGKPIVDDSEFSRETEDVEDVRGIEDPEDTDFDPECLDGKHCVCCGGDEDEPEPEEGEDLDLRGGRR